jgi:aminopeptidase YwaD
VLREVAGTEAQQDRPGRNSDQGFYGIGLPLLQFNHDRTDPGGRYWFWHTEEDTFDKIDFDILAGDSRLYVSALSRLLTSPIPPIRLQGATSELKERLEERQKWAGSRFDLAKAIEKAAELDTFARGLDARLASYEPEGQLAGAIARQMVRVIRPVLRVTYQEHGPYHQDPALEVPTLPGLAALETLGRLPANSDQLGFTMTHLVRERNRLLDHLEQAITEARALDSLLEGSTSN